MGDAGDAYEMNDEMIVDSQEPLTLDGYKKGKEEVSVKDTKKDLRSFFLSIFNLMNAILGSGILGLAEAMMNLGVVLFYTLLLMTACLAGYTIKLLLTVSGITQEKSYEGLAYKSFGMPGKYVTCLMIIIHCLGAMCSYVFIIKVEMPVLMEVFFDIDPKNVPFYFTGEFLMMMVVLLVIVPLASMKDIRFLGYSSAFGMACMLLFTFTVVAKFFTIDCPLHHAVNSTHYENTTEPTGTTVHAVVVDQHGHGSSDDVEQVCEAELAKMNSRSAYAVPTMFFAFMCHASMLPIYAELRRPDTAKMQKVANISIFNVLALYMLSASFGYFTFYNAVESELLLTYQKADPDDPLVILSRFMVLICVTLSVPLLHYPCRKTIITTLFPNPHEFSWLRHLLVMAGCIAVTVVMVTFVPNIRDIFGIAGATSSASLLVVFPCLFYLRLTNARNGGKYTRIFVGILLIFGVAFMIMSVVFIVIDWMS